MKTEKQLCDLAYRIQDASNFVPVCRELGEMVIALKDAGVPHEKLRDHPAIIILVDKINDMMYRPDLGKVMDAMGYCREKSEEVRKEQTYIEA